MKWKYRLTRHLLFWLVYGFFFFLQSLVPSRADDFSEESMYQIAAVSLLCFITACMFSSYVAIYLIWPKLLKAKKYGWAFIAFVAVFVIDVLVNYFFSGVFHNSTVVSESGKGFGSQLSLGYLNAIWAITVMGLAMFIKLSKVGYLQQQENLAIARKSVRTYLDVEKARLRPAYLYSSLNNIGFRNAAGLPGADQMILKLSDVLSYTLYESEAEFVPVNTEIAALIDFIELEKLKDDGREHVLLEWDVPEEFMLPPTLILSFVQELVTVYHEHIVKDWVLSISIVGSFEEVCITIDGTSADVQEEIVGAINKVKSRLLTIYLENGFDVDVNVDSERFRFIIVLYEVQNTLTPSDSSRV